MKPISISNIEPMFCMCGSVVRQCSHCKKEFEEGHHHRITDGILSVQKGLLTTDNINCIFCGNITTTNDRIFRDKKTATKLFKERE